MRAFTYNKNQFFEAYIIYLYVNIITKRENDLSNSNKIIVQKVQRWYEGKARLLDLRADYISGLNTVFHGLKIALFLSYQNIFFSLFTT